ncbi:MAG: SEC-C metal-binding domain-containing protein [Spirochaetota bacterium]|nr:SEC-C metal-binding domain-containing protein [Spirochaetota bacterium]
MTEKFGRNEPCPCGSGKKYKKCCLLKDTIVSGEMFNEDALKDYQDMMDNWDHEKSPSPTFMEYMDNPNLATKAIHDMNKLAEGREFQSKEELQASINEHMKARNNAPLKEFLGLSPIQMNSMLNNDIDGNGHILKINRNLPALSVQDVPALKQCHYILNKIGEQEKGLKATQRGNLPRAIVQDFYETFVKDNSTSHSKPMKEDDVKDIQRSKYFLNDTGFIKLQKGKYSLTHNGRKLLKYFDAVGFYLLLFNYFAETYNWLYGTYFPDTMEFLQRSFLFCLYLIKSKANSFIAGDKLAQTYLNAFPKLIEDIDSNYGETMVLSGFCYLFCEEFACYLGLMDMKKKKDLLYRREFQFKTTELFNKLIIWKLPIGSA